MRFFCPENKGTSGRTFRGSFYLSNRGESKGEACPLAKRPMSSDRFPSKPKREQQPQANMEASLCRKISLPILSHKAHKKTLSHKAPQNKRRRGLIFVELPHQGEVGGVRVLRREVPRHVQDQVVADAEPPGCVGVTANPLGGCVLK